ncbi:hypothetical protein SAMN05443635_102458 [Roseobacter denitrificans OCh 114]|nr:hypothetical protein SAMN05443635_102458 [Roseobacter denitrificans OCh 114]
MKALQSNAGQIPVVQRVKTEEVPLTTLKNPVKQGARLALGGSANATPAAILATARASYQVNLARGRALLATLAERQVDPDNDFEPVPGDEGTMSAEAQAAQSRESAKMFSERYDSRIGTENSRPDMDYNIATRGKGAHEAAYTNMYSLENNAIETATNYASRDPNRADGAFLNNSEIFWNQWNTAVKKGVKPVRKRASKRKAKSRALAQVARTYISNGDTGLTVHYALPNGVYFDAGYAVTFGPDQEEFAALLGTPNGRAVGYLLNDHFHEMDNPNHAGVDVDGDRSALVFRFG